MFSILIPAYNSPQSLDLCLRSIIEGASNIKQLEIIVGDDSGSDINKEVLNKYKDYIQVLDFEQNVGLPQMTNSLVYNASKEWVLIVNDDNIFPFLFDTKLTIYGGGHCVAPNQIEPYPSIFNEFVIHDLGRNPLTFNLENYWRFEEKISKNYIKNINNRGGTLPIFIRKKDFMKVGGWDISYGTGGYVADIDFFHKCKLSDINLLRDCSLHFYHFVSLSTPTPQQKLIRQQKEQEAWEYAEFKWGKGNLKHNLL